MLGRSRCCAAAWITTLPMCSARAMCRRASMVRWMRNVRSGKGSSFLLGELRQALRAAAGRRSAGSSAIMRSRAMAWNVTPGLNCVDARLVPEVGLAEFHEPAALRAARKGPRRSPRRSAS